MTDDVDDTTVAQWHSLFDRWAALEEAKAAASEDLKEFFAECKANGREPKLLRVAFRHHRALETNAEAIEADEAIVDLILAALARPRVGARPARAA